MARNDALATPDKLRLLRALAFHVHRKRPADEALTEVIDQESRGGRHRVFRPAADVLASGGFAAALQTLGMVGDEAAALLAVIVEAHDHRLLANALNALADYVERG